MTSYRIGRVSYSLLLITILITNAFLFTLFTPQEVRASDVNVWWPTNGAHMVGTQPFKAMIAGMDVSQYTMYWQVGDGQLNQMDNNYTDYQHKEASVDLSGWTWHGSGPYVVTFIAKQNGQMVAQQQETIYVDNGLAQQSSSQAQTPSSATTAVVPSNTVVPSVSISTPVITISSPVTTDTSGAKFYVNPNSSATAQARAWANNPTDAAAMKLIAAQPTAVWFGQWNSNVESDVHSLVTAAAAQRTTPVMVAYNIPERDCGGFSSGGENTPSGYLSWVHSLASGIGSNAALVILEPDSLAQIGCLSSADQQTRLQLLSQAVNILKQNANTRVYLDAGHSGWVDPSTMASRLSSANISSADGFSLNVSNFSATSNEVSYGQQVSSHAGGKHFVIDTSRNGNGSNGEWCNPSGRAIGATPTTQTGTSLVDAFVWAKVPGESDGNCNGGPSAGQWWSSYALQLVQNAH
jgi:endoglucanase